MDGSMAVAPAILPGGIVLCLADLPAAQGRHQSAPLRPASSIGTFSLHSALQSVPRYLTLPINTLTT